MPTAQTNQTLAIRHSATNPHHHLWNNNGTWWLHFTLRSSTGTKKRHRLSLKTRDIDLAIRKRDRILNAVKCASGHITAA